MGVVGDQLSFARPDSRERMHLPPIALCDGLQKLLRQRGEPVALVTQQYVLSLAQ